MTQETELPDTGMREIIIDSIDSCTQLMMAMVQGDKFRLVSVSNTGLTGDQRRLTFLRKGVGEPTTVAVPVEVLRIVLDVLQIDPDPPDYIGTRYHEAYKLLQPYTKV